MSKHVVAFTGEFKIERVRAGTCTQTIRPIGSRPKERGDELLLHGWEGRPYFTKWSWRIPGVVVSGVEKIAIDTFNGIYFYNTGRWETWNNLEVVNLALRDGFTRDDDHSPGEVMRDWFGGTYGPMLEKKFQIITWSGARIIIDNMKREGVFNPVPEEIEALKAQGNWDPSWIRNMADKT